MIIDRRERTFYEPSDLFRSLGTYYGYVQPAGHMGDPGAESVFIGCFVVDGFGALAHVDGAAQVRAKQEVLGA